MALIRRMAAGDADALSLLYARHGAGLMAYVSGLVEDRRLAEEILQDVMLAAWSAAQRFRGESKVRTWLLTIAHNRAVNVRRRGGADRSGITGAAPGEIVAMSPEAVPDVEVSDLRGALARLPHGQRAALELVFSHGLTMGEAADVLGVAPGTVKSRLHRAKRALRVPLADEEPRDE